MWAKPGAVVCAASIFVLPVQSMQTSTPLKGTPATHLNSRWTSNDPSGYTISQPLMLGNDFSYCAAGCAELSSFLHLFRVCVRRVVADLLPNTVWGAVGGPCH